MLGRDTIDWFRFGRLETCIHGGIVRTSLLSIVASRDPGLEKSFTFVSTVSPRRAIRSEAVTRVVIV